MIENICPDCGQIGFVRVRSATGEDSTPVSNVQITLRRTDVVGAQYNRSFSTDADGLSANISVTCPVKTWSLDENNVTQLPYSVFTLSSQVTGFGNVLIEGIQCFAGEIAMVDLVLIPAGEQGETLGDDDFIIPEHKLFSGGGGSAPAPILSCVSPRILVEPVIPEKIIIHLGKPAAAAKNVTVSFRDYIKNVASSEVYPTWPEESLRANIHAQISLALNRIYTEWYKSKGYAFDITNSTSYDQYYVHGRNIFEVMSRITDDIFNTYVRRPGTINPYYTEYCDGKIVPNCKGMKQWGTVTLANQGKNALQILRNYYGDVEIVRTSNIGKVPESYPGTPLREGSTGASVRTIQRQLNRIAKDYPFFGTTAVDGVFGPTTTAIVKKFQKQFSLTQDGIVGRSTWYKISYIYVAVKDLAELTSEGEKPSGDVVAGTYPGSPLRRGSSGPNVEQIQFWLNTVGKYVTTIATIAEDGVFGLGTENAVKAFQKHYSLNVDGIVGLGTWNELYKQYSSIITDVPPNVNRPGQFPGTVLRTGSTGEDVKQMQFYLRIISRFNSAIPTITADGIFGAGTQSAVRSFQSAYGLGVDGAVGKLTWNKIYEVYTSLINGILPPTQRPGTYPGSPLRRGDSGVGVKELQYYLYLLSAYYPVIPVIAYDGQFGLATENAVKAYQRLANLTVDGIVGRATWDSIYARFSKLREVDGPVFAYKVLEYPVRVLSVGAGGDEVKFIQYLLLYIGFYYDVVLPVVFSGEYDIETAHSVASFQDLAQIPVTGEVNEQTWNFLVATWLTLASELSTPATQNGEYPGYVLTLGSAGSAVKQLQEYMNSIAIRYCVADFVPETGIFDLVTLNAVRSFQEGLDLPVTGYVDKETWDAIYKFYITEV